MGEGNVGLFWEIFRLLSGRYPQYARLCDKSVIREGNKIIYNSAVLEDHHALIPLRQLPENADAQERNIFDLVLKSFFTVCMKDYIYNKKRLLFHVGDYVLRTQLNEVVQYGFRENVKETEEKDEYVQEVQKFDEKTGKVIKLDILQKETRPQKEFSIDTLLGFMENPHNEEDGKLSGLGTPATRAAILKLLFDRQYIMEERKKLYASQKGLYLLGQLRKNENLKMIADVAQTTEWEKQLTRNPLEFENAIAQYLKNCMGSARTEKYTAPPIGVCPRCGNKILEGKKTIIAQGTRTKTPVRFPYSKPLPAPIYRIKMCHYCYPANVQV
jgi:DNA topoisomerase-3